MAIKISGTTVISDTAVLQNVTGLKTINGEAILGTGNIVTSGNYAMRVYTGSATWTKPDNLRAIKVTVVGGGGASSNQASTTVPGAGAGGTAIAYINAPAIPGPVAITVGEGGFTTNIAVINGNTSSFGALVTATGGVAGRTTGAGGTATGGTFNVNGQPGGVTSAAGLTFAYEYFQTLPSPQGGPTPQVSNFGGTIARTGDGGDSLFGFGGRGSLSGSSATNTNPGPDVGISARQGTGYGAGASGQYLNGVATATTANGTAGIVIVEEFY